MGETLFLAHRIPFPADRGDKIRSHHILKHLASLGRIHVGTFAEDERDISHADKIAGLSQSWHLARRNKNMAVAGAQALLSNRPISLTAFHARSLADYVARTLTENEISTIFVFSGQMAQYVPRDFAGRFVMDFVDVDSAKFAGYADDAAMPLRALYRREAKLLAAFERSVAARADASLFVSRAEAATFLNALDGAPARVHPLYNGIDTAFYDPLRVAAEPSLANRSTPSLVFTGQMDYPPNRQAVRHFAKAILPRVRELHPGTSFAIVGRNPAPDVLELDGRDGVVVTGEVPDVRGWIKAASVVVAPLRIARGIQNKVLEAMAMARPVVASATAATGIDADDGRQFLIAQDDKDFISHVTDLLSDPARASEIGHEARHLVDTQMSWPAALAPLNELVGASPSSPRKVA